MMTLGTIFTGTAYAMSGKEKAKEQGPAINAGSKDEEQFIQYVGTPGSLIAMVDFLKMSNLGISSSKRLPREKRRKHRWVNPKGAGAFDRCGDVVIY